MEGMGTVQFMWDEDTQVLLLKEKGAAQGYPIEFNRIATPIALIGWLDHLLEKNWFDAWDAKNMIELVCEERKWNRHSI
jgi:hypothetical protein